MRRPRGAIYCGHGREVRPDVLRLQAVHVDDGTDCAGVGR